MAVCGARIQDNLPVMSTASQHEHAHHVASPGKCARLAARHGHELRPPEWLGAGATVRAF
eukprot:359590-Chlamydomonas_euryale.AAC.17